MSAEDARWLVHVEQNRLRHEQERRPATEAAVRELADEIRDLRQTVTEALERLREAA